MARKLTVEKKFPEEGVIFYKEGPVKFLCGRLSFPHLHEPQTFKGKDGKADVSKYSLELLIKSDRFQESKKYLVEKIKKIMEEKDCKCPKANWFILEGDPDERPELEGVYRVKASESEDRRPVIVDENGEDVDGSKAIRDMFYAGCYVDVLVNPWGMKWTDGSTTSKRVNASLLSIKFRKDGERFGEEPIDPNEAWAEDDDFEEEGSGDKQTRRPAKEEFNEDDDL